MAWRGLYEDTLKVLSIPYSAHISSEATIQKLTLQGVALARLQQFSEANRRFAEAEDLCAGVVSVACGAVPRGRGVLALKRGQFALARGYFLQSREFGKKYHDKSLESTALLNLGFVSLQTNRYDEAVDWSNAAYRAGLELGEENQIQAALGNLGTAYLGLGDAERAIELLVEAEQRSTRLGNVRDQIEWLTNIGYAYTNAGKIQAARQAYGQALLLARQINSSEDISDILTDLGLVAVASGNSDEADTYSKQALSMAQQSGSRPDMLDAMAIQMQAAALHGNTPRAEYLLHEVEAAPESQTSMKWASEHALARLYEKQAQIAKAQNAYASALATFESARADVQQINSQLPFLANATGIYDDYIHFLVSQGKSGEALLAADQSRARTLAQGLDVAEDQTSGNQSIKQSLKRSEKQPSVKSAPLAPQAVARKAGATLLFYWLGEKQSYLWAITPEKTTLFPLPPQAELTTHIERYRKALTGPEDPLEAANPDGQALYAMLVAPAIELLRKNPNRPVMILSDGELSQLNFETLLVTGPKPHYWIDDATIVAAPSLAMLAAAKPSGLDSRVDARIAGHKLLLMGDAISPGEEYASLPHASSEVKQIEKHFVARDQLVFTQAQATPSAYLGSNPRQFAYIHFVSHGVASRTDPLDSAIILSRSSAAEDSFKLYAREVMQHPIDARLVTISACYGSGTRAYVGEGLVGLSWAFLRAGAHNAIGALWEASDDATPGLMDALYQGLESGQSPAAALRQAKLTLLHSRSVFRKPLYWAPFQMYTRL
jgi:CHAT domain-containing protein/cell fate (sporulation/competence/biofilm development) regulator YlbF (YheA/YmcA/DUF963 family)